MTTWQLDPTGRFPQALADHLVGFRPDGRVPTQLEVNLESWDWLVKNGFVYHNVGHARCTGQYGFVDCSGGIVLCRNAAGVNRETDASSFYYSRLCHDLERPQWMIDRFGPGRGYQLSRDQANQTPGALKFHGRAEGTDYSDSHGHIATKAWPPNMSVEAMSHAAGVGYSTFIDDRDTYYAIPPYLDGFVVETPSPTVEIDMPNTIACTNKGSTAAGTQPYAEFLPPSKLFPYGTVILTGGASIKGDAPLGGGSNDRRWDAKPVSDHRWKSMHERSDRKGVVLVDDHGYTCAPGAGLWS